jgi:lysophospholipase L1-like esterase
MQYKQTHHGSANNFLGKDKDNPDVVAQFSNDLVVTKHLTPPSVVFLANDDNIVPILPNGVAYFSAQHHVGNGSALYCYPSGGHGFGFHTDFKYHNQMLRDLDSWLESIPSPQRGAIRVACIGNSITDGSGIFMRDLFGYPAQLQKKIGNAYIVRNYGVGRRTMLNHGDYPYMKEQAWKDALGFNPDIVIVKLGTNDSKPKNWKFSKEFAADMQQMVDSLKSLPSHPKIFLASPIKAYSSLGTISDSIIVNEICPIVKKLARRNKCQFIDLHSLYQPTEWMMQSDGIHPTIKGAEYLADIIKQFIISKK